MQIKACKKHSKNSSLLIKECDEFHSMLKVGAISQFRAIIV
ncbi:hypothetical protein [Helicobacter pylori]|nr:hypothetical protein [Helicobacter pylori]